jgi:hypothetical protein
VTAPVLAAAPPATWPDGPRLQAGITSLRRDFPAWRIWLSDQRRLWAQPRDEVALCRHGTFDADNPRAMREKLSEAGR